MEEFRAVLTDGELEPINGIAVFEEGGARMEVHYDNDGLVTSVLVAPENATFLSMSLGGSLGGSGSSPVTRNKPVGAPTECYFCIKTAKGEIYCVPIDCKSAGGLTKL